MLAKEWKCGVSDCFFGKSDRELLRLYRENGIDAVEASELVQDTADFKNAAKEYGVQIWSYHLPFWTFDEWDPCAFDTVKRERTLHMHKEHLRRAATLGAAVAVVHPSAEPNRTENRPRLMAFAKEHLRELATFAQPLGITVAVENLPRSCLGNCSDEMLELLQADPRLRVCYDTNHLLAESAAEFIRALGDKIVTVHISDYDFANEKHWLPYEGDVNWVELVTALEEIGYKGPFLYEVASAPRPMKDRTRPTIDRPRPLTLQDVRDNFEACVNKRPATPIGTRNKEECAYSADWKKRDMEELRNKK